MALHHPMRGGSICRATHREGIICLAEVVTQGGCVEGLYGFLQVGLLLVSCGRVSTSQGPHTFVWGLTTFSIPLAFALPTIPLLELGMIHAL